MKEYAVVMTAVADDGAAGELANKLLARGLAACVQVQAIHSYYPWKGEVRSQSERLLLIKTRTGRFAELAAFIRANHAYEVPEILQLPVSDGDAAYLRWIDEATGG